MRYAIIILMLCDSPLAHSIPSFEENNEILCLAKNIYFEADAQGNLGHRAVAWATLNRLKAGRWKKTICNIVYQPSRDKSRPLACQFSWTCQKNFKEEIRKGDELLFDSINIVSYRIISGIDKDDITGGATHYVRCDIAYRVKWLKNKKLTVRINDHCFYKRKGA